ncbi:MAG TPA: DUF4184 family protein [Terriglobales bacterium]
MPFTFSHPAAVLPAARTRLVLSALVIGSMAPDFEYFLAPYSRSWHEVPGIFLYCLPVSFLVLLLFHVVAKWPLLALFPRAWQAKLVRPARGFRPWPASNLLPAIVSLALGILTHVAWDNCTHATGWLALHLPVMNRVILQYHDHYLALYKAAQHGSTVLGAVVLAVAIARWYRRTPAAKEPLPPQLSGTAKVMIPVLTVLIAASAALLQAGFSWDVFFNYSLFRGFLRSATIAGITAAAAWLLVFSLGWRIFGRRDPWRESGDWGSGDSA